MKDILGEAVPLAGGYTLGQVVPGREQRLPQFLNQHILVAAFAEE